MKIIQKNWVGWALCTFILFITLSSCVKDRNYSATNFSLVTNVVDLPVTGFTALAFDVTPTPQLIKVYVELGGPIQDKDVEVTLAYDQAGLDAYNAANTDTVGANATGTITHFVKLADSAYTLPTLKVTIPKGQRLGYASLSVIPNKVDLSLQNAIAFKIVDAGGIAIASNLQSVIYAIVVKNAWDGDYNVTGWFFHPSAGRAINTVKHLSTINGTRVQAGVGDLGSTMQFDIVSNIPSNWASDAFTSFSFMTADNPGGTNYIASASNAGNSPGDALFNKTIYNNTYDPATRTFYLHYGYVNGVVGDQSKFTRQIYEKWVRK
jgi:hypothetical protein